jgi:hypothetical protein
VSVGVDQVKAQALAAAIADFRDADNFRRLGGAEEADYRAAGLAWGPKNAPFDSVDELQQVFGMTTQLYERVAPSLTTYSAVETRDFFSLPPRAYSIHAQSQGPHGAAFVREAIVQFGGATPFRILDWRSGEL